MDTKPEQEALSLFELNNLIKNVLNQTFPESWWVSAEMSDVRVNASSGHCYLEFIEKDAISGQLIAKARGAIWAKTFRMLKPCFEQETGQRFTSGLKVLVKVTVEFHELYGYSLSVIDIDPAYTLGDLIKRRREIIRQLKEEGVFDLNKELELSETPQRIAVITSPTAAGYEDFMHQLADNQAAYVFYTHLFPAIMQGDRTEESIIAALDRIYAASTNFDAVVIIRGGGASSDLNSFDSYLLAANCAQFPLPVITGIGHERDDTVLDLVAHTRMKTPTAVAEFLIQQMQQAAGELNRLQQQLVNYSTTRLQREAVQIQQFIFRIPSTLNAKIERDRFFLSDVIQRVPRIIDSDLLMHNRQMTEFEMQLPAKITAFLNRNETQLMHAEQLIRIVSPEAVLKRGYTITRCNGKIIKKAAELTFGDEITTLFIDGEVKSKIIR